MTPRGISNNNPGNIVKSSVPWEGKVHGSDPVFETFSVPQDGINAMAKLLLNYQKDHFLTTIEDIIKRWSATDQAAYAQNIGVLMGTDKTAPVNLTFQPSLIVFMAGIIQQENGEQPYPLTMLAFAAQRAIKGA